MLVDFSKKLLGVKEKPDQDDLSLEGVALHLLWVIDEKDPAAKRRKFKLASQISVAREPLEVSDEDRKYLADLAFEHLPTLAAGRVSEVLGVEV